MPQFDDGGAVVAFDLAVDLGLEGVVDGDDLFDAPVFVGGPDVERTFGVGDIGLAGLKIFAGRSRLATGLGGGGGLSRSFRSTLPRGATVPCLGNSPSVLPGLSREIQKVPVRNPINRTKTPPDAIDTPSKSLLFMMSPGSQRIESPNPALLKEPPLRGAQNRTSLTSLAKWQVSPSWDTRTSFAAQRSGFPCSTSRLTQVFELYRRPTSRRRFVSGLLSRSLKLRGKKS